MSESKQPANGDDELDDFLAGRSELSRAYRREADGINAPAALDAAVLAAAQASAPVVRRRAGQARRWRLPLGLAASMVFGIAVLREVPREPAVPMAAREAAPVAVEAPPPASDVEASSPPEVTAPAPRAPRAPRAPKLRAPAPEPHGAVPEAAAIAGSAPAPVVALEAEALADRAVQAEAARSMAAMKAASPPDVWQAARYQGLELGTATLADWQHQLDRPAVMSAPSGDARLSAKRKAEPLREVAPRLESGQQTDPRGRLRTRLDAQRQTVDAVLLELTPPLPLDDVERTEGLQGVVGEGGGEAARETDRSACRDGRAPAADQGRVMRRLYPERGLELRLDAAGRVTEIRYLATRPTQDC